MAYDAVSKMETKKYDERRKVETIKTMKDKQWERTISSHNCSTLGVCCVICLEEFRQGQVLLLLHRMRRKTLFKYVTSCCSVHNDQLPNVTYVIHTTSVYSGNSRSFVWPRIPFEVCRSLAADKLYVSTVHVEHCW